MASDVEIDRAALARAQLLLGDALWRLGMHLEDAWRRDTGVQDPCGRTHLRVMLEDAIGQALVAARGHIDDGRAASAQLGEIAASFAELDASLGDGWDGDRAADLA